MSSATAYVHLRLLDYFYHHFGPRQIFIVANNLFCPVKDLPEIQELLTSQHVRFEVL